MNNTFKREEFSSALLNTDHEALKAYKIKREKMKKIQELESDINTLKQDITEIKSLLQQILIRG